MKFRYTPEGAEPREWDYRADKLLNVEAEEIERVTGMRFGEFTEAVLQTSVRAIHGLLYVFMRRDAPGIKYDQVQFAMGEIELDFTREEKIELRDALRKQLDAGAEVDDPAAMDAALAELDAEIGPEPEQADDGTPKASVEPSSESDGGSISPRISTSIHAI